MSALTREAVRHCSDIGMFALDRPVSSCRHATAFCRKHCYNRKLYAAFGHDMRPKDVKNEAAWHELCREPSALKRTLDKKRLDTSRVRLMTRGEAFSDVRDVLQVRRMLQADPGRLYWIPTRAWRVPYLRRIVQALVMSLPNARVMASIDPSNTSSDVEAITAAGWSTMFFGDDNATVGRFLCPKTHAEGRCIDCQGGCFEAGQVHIHLLQH